MQLPFNNSWRVAVSIILGVITKFGDISTPGTAELEVLVQFLEAAKWYSFQTFAPSALVSVGVCLASAALFGRYGLGTRQRVLGPYDWHHWYLLEMCVASYASQKRNRTMIIMCVCALCLLHLAVE